MWKVSTESLVSKSKFVGRISCCRSLEQARQMLRDLKKEKALKDASHHISAIRVSTNGSSILEEANDNGEPPAARRMLQALRTEGLTDIILVVTRWYGGKKLGSDRFRAIDDVARETIDLWKRRPSPSRA